MTPLSNTVAPRRNSKSDLAAILDRWSDAELQQGHHALAEKLAFEAEKVRAEVRS